MMRFKTLLVVAASAHMILALAGPLDFQNSDVTLLVSAKMDIYRAAGYPDGSDGEAPASYIFPARSRQTLIFSSVTGTWTCGHGVAPFGASGTTKCPAVNIANPVGRYGGYSATASARNIPTIAPWKSAFSTSVTSPLYTSPGSGGLAVTAAGGGALNLSTSASTSAATGAVAISSGANGGTGGTGNVTIDAGATAISPGQVQIGVNNASAVSVGNAGATTTVNGPLTVVGRAPSPAPDALVRPGRASTKAVGVT